MAGIKKTTTVEAHAGTSERLVIDLSIEEDLQIEIKDTLAHKNKLYVQWFGTLAYEERNKNKVKLIVHMIWDGVRDHLEGDMTPLLGFPSSLARYLRLLLVWSSIQSSAESLILRIKGYNKHKNMGDQRTLRGALTLWRLMQF